MNPWQAEHATLDLLAKTAFTGWAVYGPNVAFTRPALGSVSNPAKYARWLPVGESTEIKSAGRTREVQGALRVELGVQAGGGVAPINSAFWALDLAADAASTSAFYFKGVERGDVDMGVTDKQWFIQHADLPFLRFGVTSASEVAQIMGIGENSVTRDISGVAVLDVVGSDAGTLRKVRATAGEPEPLGVVTHIIDADTAIITVTGAVNRPGHGLSIGPAYLSQTVLGQLTATAPTSGLFRHVVEVVDADNFIVRIFAEAEL